VSIIGKVLRQPTCQPRRAPREGYPPPVPRLPLLRRPARGGITRPGC